jgi:hypothetical protein
VEFRVQSSKFQFVRLFRQVSEEEFGVRVRVSAQQLLPQLPTETIEKTREHILHESKTFHSTSRFPNGFGTRYRISLTFSSGFPYFSFLVNVGERCCQTF